MEYIDILRKNIYLHRVTSEPAALFCHRGRGKQEVNISLPKLATKAM